MRTANPYNISGTYGSRPGFRIALCALLFAVVAITAVCVHASLQWVGAPFNGFLMGRNRIVAPIDLPSWSGRAANIPYWSQVVSIDGEPLASTEDALRIAAEAGDGAKLRYGFSDGSRVTELEIPVITFTVGDWIGLFANYLINGLALLAIGFFVVLLRPELRAAQALLLFSLSWGTSLIIGLADFSSFHFRALLAIAEGFVPASLFYLTLCFPTERPLHSRRGMLRVVVASSALLAALNVVLYDTAPRIWTLAYRAGVVWVVLVILLSVHTAWRENRAASPIDQEKRKIVLLGIVTAFGLPFLLLGFSQLVGAELPLNIVTAGWWIFPATLAYAIVQRDLFEIDVFLRRASTYVALSTSVFLVYAAVLGFLSHGFYSLQLTTSPWFTLLFSLAVLACFHPLREGLQRTVDRLFFRTRFDYAETTRAVSQALNQTLSAEEIAEHVRETLNNTMAPTDTGIYRAIGGNFEPIQETAVAVQLDTATVQTLGQGRIIDGGKLPRETSAALPPTALLVPLCFEDRLEGVLQLGPKNSGTTYGPHDLELLRTLANQTAMALRNAASYNRVTELLASLETRVEERTHELQQTQEELRRSNERLRELDRLKTQFFADASHELRTPLTLVLGPLEELVRQSNNLPDGPRKLAETARSNAATLLVLTDTLLDISRIDYGQMRPTLGDEPLLGMTEAIVEPFRWLAEQRTVAIRLEGDREITARCDRNMIAKVVGNLLANALKFTRDGEVAVRASRVGDKVCLEVHDTGPGIPAEELPQIFERYRQASTASHSGFTGSGIGLALARELVELQGGRIDVTSQVGHGTTFHITLPAGAPSASDTTAPRALADESLAALADKGLTALAASAARSHSGLPVAKQGATDRPTVLIVEDNAEMREFVRAVLNKTYNLESAADAGEAIAKARTKHLDLIVSDIMMPGPDGIALCQTLKEDPDLRHIPLILLTARASLDSKLTGLAAGADDYITKPFHPDELNARVAALLRIRSMEAELRISHGQLSRAYDDLRETQAQLVHSEKMAALGTLVAGVAHEINNPVSFVHSSIDLIADSIEELKEILDRHLADESSTVAALHAEVDADERLTTLLENAAICKDGARRAARIVQDLRTFSRPGVTGREPTDLHETLEQSLRLLQGEIKGRITIEREYGEVPQVSCDSGQISQVFLNLLANATQAIPAKGVVTVRTANGGDRVTVSITDDGPGMNETTASKIFDPFYTTKEVGKGTGLGLSIVRSLVNAHGGEIGVVSTLGSGTTFTVTLPTNGATHDQLDTSH